MTFTHTEVDPRFEGHGVGGRLVSQALDATREEGLAVIPVCPFVRAYIAGHPAYLDLVPAGRARNSACRPAPDAGRPARY